MKNKMTTIKPNFFIVGFPKSGTTAMHNSLAQHPEIFMSPKKEPHFLCKDLQDESKNWYNSLSGNYKKIGDIFFKIRTINQYLKLFSNVKTERIIGESSTNYIYSKTSAKEIYQINKNAKILVIIREPTAFLYSIHSQLIKKGRENISNFEKALKAEEKRKENKKIPLFVRYPSILFYSEWIKYTEMIQRYLAIFPTSQIKIIIYEDYKKNNLKIHKEILSFLSINNNFVPNFNKLNKSKNVKNIWLRSLMIKIKENLKPIIFKLIKKETTLKKIEVFFNKTLMRASRIKDKTSVLDNATKEQLMRKNLGEVKKLSELLNINLVKYWEYDKLY